MSTLIARVSIETLTKEQGEILIPIDPEYVDGYDSDSLRIAANRTLARVLGNVIGSANVRMKALSSSSRILEVLKEDEPEPVVLVSYRGDGGPDS